MSTILNWWRTLSGLQQTQLCDIHTEELGGIKRREKLTNEEIEMLYNSKLTHKILGKPERK